MKRNRFWLLVAVIMTLGGLAVFMAVVRMAPEVQFDPRQRATLVRGIAGGSGDDLKTPLDVAVDTKGKIYVADAGNNKVRIFSSRGKQLRVLAGDFRYPNTVVVDKSGKVFVGEFEAQRIQVFNRHGKRVQVIDKGTVGRVIEPLDLALDSGGNLYVADRQGGLLILTNTGRLARQIFRVEANSTQFSFPNGVDVDDQGEILLSDSGNLRVLLLDYSGKVKASYKSGDLYYPRGVSFLSSGDAVVADTFGTQILFLDKKLKVTSKIALGKEAGESFMSPNGIAVAGDRLYVADRIGNRVLIFKYRKKL